MKNSKVVILGKLPTKFDAPFDDKSFDIWAFNKHADEEKIKRVDVWFEIHENPDKPDADILREDFPIEEVEELVGGKYFNNSVSYLIAYAILKGYKEIYLYGMRFTTDNERRKREYENVRELIFFAKGRGLKVYAPSDKIMVQEYARYK